MTEPRPSGPIHAIFADRAHGKAPKDRGAGRVCLRCETPLSRYNPHDYCWRHAPAQIGRRR